jgi:hypothetical protein
MTPKYPHHSNDAFMENATPVQSFVDPPHAVTEEERNRPRYGVPVRPSQQSPPEPPTSEPEPGTSAS